MHTRISYWVLTNEGSRVNMSPEDITAMLNQGYKLDIRIHQEYSDSYRMRLIYG